MKIEFRSTTRMGNNLRTEMFFDGLRVSEIQCTPFEFTNFYQLLHTGNEVAGNTSDEVTKDG